MSKFLVSQYHQEVEKLIQYGGTKKETAIRSAFQNLLNGYCKPKDYLLIPELDYRTKSGKTVRPDGTVKDAVRLDYGYWEAKDKYDNLDFEIEKKLAKGYPDQNILFEDSQFAVLIQHGDETGRINMRDTSGLDGLINEFVDYVPPEVTNFRSSIKSFREDIPKILVELRSLIEKQSDTNKQFTDARDKFLAICRQSINPEISLLDVREMIIQHILTEDIFISIFDESQFHQENNIARELHAVVNTFFTGKIKRNAFTKINSYYNVIKRTAANIVNHHEKQKFLKAVYENFYQAYNPKAADRLGMVYTPNEIVRFMIESVDYLTHKHFGKLLADDNVHIIEPAVGTGTFITELIEYIPKHKLKHKYKNEIHCNEIAILPYYIANLNIEYTYKQKMGEYEEFDNICLVDTLEHTSFEGKQGNLFHLSIENTERISRQNSNSISVVLGNPPYNAKQENFNDNNANRSYKHGIDKRIKETYIKHGTAQNQNNVYDPCTRFLRWALDRLDENGVVAFVVNRSYIDKRIYDGFRKVVGNEFSNIYIVDLGGDVRANPKLSGTTHNVFGIQTGVAIFIMVRRDNQDNVPCRVSYARRPEFETKYDKLKFLATTKFTSVDFTHIIPDKRHNWINQTNNDYDELLPLIDKDVKAGKSEKALFKLFSSGVKTQRDEWIYDFSRDNLQGKMQFAIDVYQQTLADSDYKDRNKIKWDAELTRYAERKIAKEFEDNNIVKSTYRPFSSKYLYFDKHFNGRTYQWFNICDRNDSENYFISIPGIGSSKPFQSLITNSITCLDCLEKTQCLSLYSYDDSGNRIENITDWGLKQFQNYYCKGDSRIAPTKLEIFHYTYAVLHNPAYREKYELNLKREFPRIPFYDNFRQWVAWGRQLMDLHINYETVEPYGLKRIDIPKEKKTKSTKVKLKVDKDKGVITLDTDTSLHGVPSEAWEYKLGNRNALEWILDQYKEKKPRDKTIAEKFNTYRFADYKEQVIDLLQRVCTVSVETMKIINAMKEL